MGPTHPGASQSVMVSGAVEVSALSQPESMMYTVVRVITSPFAGLKYVWSHRMHLLSVACVMLIKVSGWDAQFGSLKLKNW